MKNRIYFCPKGFFPEKVFTHPDKDAEWLNLDSDETRRTEELLANLKRDYENFGAGTVELKDAVYDFLGGEDGISESEACRLAMCRDAETLIAAWVNLDEWVDGVSNEHESVRLVVEKAYSSCSNETPAERAQDICEKLVPLVSWRAMSKEEIEYLAESPSAEIFITSMISQEWWKDKNLEGENSKTVELTP